MSLKDLHTDQNNKPAGFVRVTRDMKGQEMTAEVKHTPGPWFPHWNGHYHTIDIGSGENDPSVAQVHRNHVINHDFREVKANADLISAAPDLLTAAKALDAYWTIDFPDGPYGGREYKKGLGGTLADDTVELWRTVRAAIAKAEGRS